MKDFELQAGELLKVPVAPIVEPEVLPVVPVAEVDNRVVLSDAEVREGIEIEHRERDLEVAKIEVSEAEGGKIPDSVRARTGLLLGIGGVLAGVGAVLLRGC